MKGCSYKGGLGCKPMMGGSTGGLSAKPGKGKGKVAKGMKKGKSPKKSREEY